MWTRAAAYIWLQDEDNDGDDEEQPSRDANTLTSARISTLFAGMPQP